jgi:Xaa-Pro dipeptidase
VARLRKMKGRQIIVLGGSLSPQVFRGNVGQFAAPYSSAMTARTQKLADAMTDAGVDCYLAWDPITMTYLQGFAEGSHERFLVLALRTDGSVRLICPALSETQARRSGIDDIRSWADGEDPIALFLDLARDWNLESAIIAVDAVMPARQLLQLQYALPAALFRNGEDLLSSLMRVKDASEMDLMRKAGRIADEAYAEVKPKIREGMTERQVSRMLSEAMSDRGSQPTFSIVAAGANGAEPHHLTDDTRLKRGDVVILDFGCDVGGYQSDITRVVAIGEASAKAREIYDIVYRAHMAGRGAIRSGIAAEEIDRACRAVIKDAGYGPKFFHRTGHGIGMNGHEHPNIVAGNLDPLEPGNCFSVEPGIYLEGEFGVRIENIVACTEGGHESMNVDPSAILETIG